MEPDQPQTPPSTEPANTDAQPSVSTHPSPLHTITPLSKYLAMTLFIILPFVGGYIGYQYATISTDTVVESNTTTLNTSSSTTDAPESTNSIDHKAIWGEREASYGETLISFSQDDYEFQVIDEPLASSYGGKVYVRFRGAPVVYPGSGILYLDTRLQNTPTSSWFVTDLDINEDGLPDLGLRNEFNQDYQYFELQSDDEVFSLRASEVITDDQFVPSNSNWGGAQPLAIDQYDPIVINGTAYSSSTGGFLSYTAEGFYINNLLVHSVSAGDFEIYPTDGNSLKYNFLRLDDQIFGMRFIDLASVQLIPIQTNNAAVFETVGNGYAMDDTSYFYVTNAEPLQPKYPSEQHLFIELEAVTEPVFVVGEQVYHRGKLLEGLVYSTMQIGEVDGKPTGFYLKDADSVYVQEVDCHLGSYYVEGTTDMIESWRPGC